MNLDDITTLILTRDEAPNIARVLDRLTWTRRILVVDSGSSDETLEIVSRHPQAEVFERPFVSFASQCNFGLRQVDTEWVLSLDADYVLSETLVEEIAGLSPIDALSGYRARFRYCIDGRPLRGSLYPPRAVLYRRAGAYYEDDGHGHRVRLPGPVSTLEKPIFHDDRKPLGRWLRNQLTYARLEAEKLRALQPKGLGRLDKLRRKGWVVPMLTPFYCLFAKGLVLDGRAGLTYSFQRTYAEVLLALMLHERGEPRAPAEPKAPEHASTTALP